MLKKCVYPLMLLATAALLSLPIIGQEQDAGQTAQAFIDGLDVREPELAERALVIEDTFVSPGGSKLIVRVRNHDWRTITAWAVEVVFGSREGQARHSVYAADYYVTLLDEKPEERSAIRPGDSQELEYELPESYSLSEDRFARGDYSVATVRVQAVVFDDGSFSGSNLEPVQYILKQRYARAVAIVRMLDRIDSAQRSGTPDSLLEPAQIEAATRAARSPLEPIGRHQETTRFDLAAFIHREENTVGEQWAVAVRRALWNEAAALGQAPQDLRALDPQVLAPDALHRAVEDASRFFLQTELDLLAANLPESLRPNVGRILDERIER